LYLLAGLAHAYGGSFFSLAVYPFAWQVSKREEAPKDKRPTPDSDLFDGRDWPIAPILVNIIKRDFYNNPAFLRTISTAPSFLLIGILPRWRKAEVRL